MSSYDIRAAARRALEGKWPTAVLVGFVASLLGGTASSGGPSFDFDLSEWTDLGLEPEIMAPLIGILAAVAAIGAIYGIALFVVGGAVQLGYCRFNLKLVDGYMGTVGDLFSKFDRLGQALLMNILMGLFVSLWSLLLIVPGIVAAYKYAMAPYILLEDPDCTAMEAIRRSKQMMDGHKGELFSLDISFIGWVLLSILTLGIGGLFLTPYTAAARAVFYRSLQVRSAPQMEAPMDTFSEF